MNIWSRKGERGERGIFRVSTLKWANAMDWKSFRDSFATGSRYGAPVSKPTRSQLNRLEKTLGVGLPKSYREFIVVFGPGEFSSSLEVAAPHYENLSSPAFDIIEANRAYKFEAQQLRLFQAPDRTIIERLLFFGLLDEKYPVGWDLQEVCNAEDCEYAVYRVGLNEAERVAESFQQFVQDACDKIFAPNPDWDENELGPHRVFHPTSYDE